jgi:rhodanese-related sulfurtransferase
MMASITVETLAERLRDGPAIATLDVREEWELALCRLPDSMHIPLSLLPEAIDALPRDHDLAVICHHGFRSAQAVAWLHQQGFNRAINLEGGIDAWAKRIDRSMRVY